VETTRGQGLKRHRFGIAIALAALLAVAGCGGGGSGGGDRLTKEEYIAQADAICKATEEKLDALAEPTSKEEFASFLEEGLGLSEGQLDDLRALNPPEADEATLEEAYSLVEQQLDVIRQMVDAVKADDEAAVQELITQGDALNDQADQIAADYGLKECGGD